MPLVYVIILNYNGALVTLDCLRSVLQLDYANFRVLVVDNASTDDSVAHLCTTLTDPRMELLVNSKNEGYAGGNNRGIEKALAAGAAYIWVLNNDTLVAPGCLAPQVEAMESDPSIGVCGGPLVDVGRESSPNRGQRLSLYTGEASHWPHVGDVSGHVEVDYICGAAVLFRGETLGRIGLFDERYFLLCEDADLCFRARQTGCKVCFVPGPGIRHLTSYTIRQFRPIQTFCGIRSRAWFIRRYGAWRHRMVFALLSFSYFYPKILLGRLWRREPRLIPVVLKAIWEGHLQPIPPTIPAAARSALECGSLLPLSRRELARGFSAQGRR